MLNFKKTEIADIDIFKRYLTDDGEFSCENTFVNLLVWQSVYGNMWAESDGQLIIKSGVGENEVFRLPLGNDIKKGIGLIKEYCGDKEPKFWTQDGKRLEKFRSYLGDMYGLEEVRDAFDYIYLQGDLAELSGKKYHGKRNHINAFSEKYAWEYKKITEENIDDIKKCAEAWYSERASEGDKFLSCEREGINTLLDNAELLGIRGGAIYVNGSAVAFTIGSAVNSRVFDIHIEKALSSYAEAYTVINREFAKTLDDFEYINREDDMGLEGLRKAKLSYRPAILLKKYFCVKRVE